MNKLKLLKTFQERKKALLSDLDKVKSTSTLEEDHWVSMDEIGDEARENQEKLTKQEAIELIEDRIRIIEQAEKDLENERYGICNKCGAEIGEDRLLAFPEAQYCIKCQLQKDH